MSVPKLELTNLQSTERISCTDAEEALNRFINKKELPPLELKQKVFQLLDRLRIDAATNRYYKEAGKYQQITKDLQQRFLVEQEMEQIRSTSRRKDSTRFNMESKLGSTCRQYDREIEAYKHKRYEELNKLKKQHQLQIHEFTEKWKDSKHMQEFSKPSPQLLQLRQIERKQVILGDYEAADITSQRANALEKEETKKANERAISKMKMDYNNLLKKQEAEIDNFNTRTQLQIQALETQKENQAETLNTCIRLSQPFPRPQQRKSRKISPERAIILKKGRPKSEIANQPPDVSLSTPRTFKKMMDIRTGIPGVKLGLDGIDITQHIKKPKRSGSSMK